jgi:hypothetical protein
MFELTGQLHSTAFTANGRPLVTFELDQRKDALKMADSLKELRVAVR